MNRLDAGLLIAIERRRQIDVEGWTADHDDKHNEKGTMLSAAKCYLYSSKICCVKEFAPAIWPWSPQWWKPKGRRKDLVRAGALVWAEKDLVMRTGKFMPNYYRECDKLQEEILEELMKLALVEPEGRNPNGIYVGDRVTKISGDYKYHGHVVAIFQKRNGKRQVRMVVENDDGLLFIFNSSQIKKDEVQ